MVKSINSLLLDVWQVYVTLLKVMVPALILVKALDMLGGTQWLAMALAPLMSLVGLPEQMDWYGRRRCYLHTRCR